MVPASSVSSCSERISAPNDVMESLTGLFAPLVTPFTDDGAAVSEVRLARLIRFLIDRGIAGFAVATDSGEFVSLSFNERKSLVEMVMRESAGRPVIVNVSTMSTSATLDLAQHASRHGARAVILMPPYFGRYSSEEIFRFFETTAHYGNIAIIAVDPQGRLESELSDRISTIPGVRIAEPIPQPLPHPPYTDSFRLGGMIVTPTALLVNSGDLAPLDALIAEHGGKRIGKIGLELLDVEVGTPRAPTMFPGKEVSDTLRNMLVQV